MEKIKKGFILLIIASFVCQSVVFGANKTHSTLRPPMKFDTTQVEDEEIRLTSMETADTIEFRSGNIDIANLGEPKIIYIPEEGMVRESWRLIEKESGEVYAEDIMKQIVERLGISPCFNNDKDRENFMEFLDEIIGNSLFHHAGNENKDRLSDAEPEPVRLKAFSYLPGKRGSDLRKIIKIVIEQKSSSDSDWQALNAEKRGFDKRGTAYLISNERRIARKRGAKLGFYRIGFTMRMFPMLLTYTRRSDPEHSLVTDVYIELPVATASVKTVNSLSATRTCQ